MPLELIPPGLGVPTDLLVNIDRFGRDLARMPMDGRLPRLVRTRAEKQQWILACLAAGELMTHPELRSTGSALGRRPRGAAASAEASASADFVRRVCSPLDGVAEPYQSQLRAALAALVESTGAGVAPTSTLATRAALGVTTSTFNRAPSLFGAIVDAMSPFGPYRHLDPVRLKAECPFKPSKGSPARVFDEASADEYTTYYAPKKARLRMDLLRCNTPTEGDGDEAYLMVGALTVPPALVRKFAKSGNLQDLGNLTPSFRRFNSPTAMFAGTEFSPHDVVCDARIGDDGLGIWMCSYSLWEDDLVDASKSAEDAKIAGQLVDEICSQIGTVLDATGNVYAQAAGLVVQIVGLIVDAVCQAYAAIVRLAAHDQPLGAGSLSSDVVYAYSDGQSFPPSRTRVAHLSASGYDYVVRFVEERIDEQVLKKGKLPPVGQVLKIPPLAQTFHFPEGHDISYWAGDKGDFTVRLEWKGYSSAEARWELALREDTAEEQVSVTEVSRRAYKKGDSRKSVDGGGTAAVDEVYVELQVHYWFNAWGIWSLNTFLKPVGGNGRCVFSISPV